MLNVYYCINKRFSLARRRKTIMFLRLEMEIIKFRPTIWLFLLSVSLKAHGD